MTIYARELTVRSYRNFDAYTLRLAEGVTVLVGRNAVGKTNLVEALQLLTSGASFRRPAPAELVKSGERSCALALSLEGEGRVLDMGCTVTAGKRSFTKNGKRCRAADVRGVVPSVLFCPDDLDMIKRSARVRRAALDTFGMQLNEQYAQLVGAYERIVEQRNALLKERWCTAEMLDAWNAALAQTGAQLLVHRRALLERIRAHLVKAYAELAPAERADVRYEASVLAAPPAVPGPTAPDADDAEFSSGGESPVAVVSPTDGPQPVDAWRARFLEALAARADEELRRGVTLVGPHRDEIRFTIDGRDARTYASQGQQRSLVLAWKVAEVAVTRDIIDRPPLLLLDDVMSELDESRREAYVCFIQDEVQTVITTTNLGYFSPAILDRAKVVTIDGAQ